MVSRRGNLPSCTDLTSFSNLFLQQSLTERVQLFTYSWIRIVIWDPSMALVTSLCFETPFGLNLDQQLKTRIMEDARRAANPLALRQPWNPTTSQSPVLAVRETGVSWHQGGPIESPPETPRTSQHYRIEGIKGVPDLGRKVVFSVHVNHTHVNPIHDQNNRTKYFFLI